MTRPPRLARALLVCLLAESERECLMGDLAEQFADARRRHGGWGAWWRYWRQTLQAIWYLGARVRHRPSSPRVRQGDSMVHRLLADVRFAFRLLLRQPAYTAVAVLSLTIAIGANGLVFGLADDLVFNPFHFPDADRLVSIGSTFPRLHGDEGFIEQHSPAEVDDFRRVAALRDVAAFDLGNRAVSNGSTAERVFTVLALDDPLPAMGQPPELGRGFTLGELAPDGPKVAIISDRLWTRLFGRDPHIIGRSIQVNSEPRTVVGVTAADATLLGSDLWIPWGATASAVPRNRRQFTVIARLAPGATLEAANAQLAAVAVSTARQFGGQYPEYQGWRLRAATWTEAVTGQARGPASLLLGAGLLVLLIACVNLATLMLARLNARRREIAVRYALGAGGWQVTRLLLFESLTIALAATGFGLLLARAVMPAITTMLPVRVITITAQPAVNFRGAAYMALVALIAAIVTAAVPAWQARRAAPQDALRGGVTSTAGRQRLRQTLVVAELTLAVVLLVGASLLLQSYARIQNIDPGFRTDHLLTMRLTLAMERYGERGATQAFFKDFTNRLQALPEVEHAAAASQFPPEEPFSIQFHVADVATPADSLPTALVTTVTPGYFDTLRIPLQRGRLLDDRDRAGQPIAVVVNEAFASRYLGGRAAGRLLLTDRRLPADVVGVVANTHNDTLLRPARPEIFATIDQGGGNNQLFLLLRTTTDPAGALPAVRRTLAGMDPDQPLYLIQTMRQAVAGSLAPQRISLLLVGAFAVAALLIACVGVYGVVSYWVATRAREIGIRMTLGASAGQVARLVAVETVRLVGVAALLGLAGGIGLGQVAHSQLYRTSATDPVALVSTVLVLGLVAVAAAYLPSRRAARVDPVRVLRME